MDIKCAPLHKSILIIPNLETTFSKVVTVENALEIVTSFTYADTADIFLTRIGAIGFTFLESGPLRSIERLVNVGGGLIPERVMQNSALVTDIIAARIAFANFISAAIHGRFCAMRHSALTGALFNGLDTFIPCDRQGRYLRVPLMDPLIHLCNRNCGTIQDHNTLVGERMSDVVDFVQKLAGRQTELSYASIEACMAMNYQAAILHNAHHSAASLALNFSVAEALVQELFLAYGLVEGHDPKRFAKRPHSISKITTRKFDDASLFQRVKMLREGGLMDQYLCERFDDCRKARNQLMHNAASVSFKTSGLMQTVVRDLWAYVLDGAFELIAGSSMRVV